MNQNAQNPQSRKASNKYLVSRALEAAVKKFATEMQVAKPDEVWVTNLVYDMLAQMAESAMPKSIDKEIQVKVIFDPETMRIDVEPTNKTSEKLFDLVGEFPSLLS